MSKKPSPLTANQQELYNLYNENDHSEYKVAKIKNMHPGQVRQLLFSVAKKGWPVMPNRFLEQAPAGFSLSHSTMQINKDGEVVQQWARIKPFEQGIDSVVKYLEERIPVTKAKIRKPTKADPDVQLEWTIADLHYAMLSWSPETGANYDSLIARHLLLDSGMDIYSRVGKVEETVVVFMGDNFQTDFFDARTERAGNILDSDTRFPKMVASGIDTFISAIEIALQFSKRVRVIVLYGNHDKQLSAVLPHILYHHFKHSKFEDRVFIDLAPTYAHYNYWGDVASCYYHGHKGKPDRMCSNFTRKCAETGKRAKYFYVKQAHLHREEIKDINGVMFEVVPSPVAPEAYVVEMGFESKRATVATAYHKKYGPVGRYEITPGALALKKKEALRNGD